MAYWALFAGVTPYDDEGTMLVTLAGLTTHGAPCTDFYSQYGPFWLAVLGGPFAVLHQPVTPAPARRDPLVRYIADDFTPTVSVGPHRLVERRGA
jgi:hypothetical protein